VVVDPMVWLWRASCGFSQRLIFGAGGKIYISLSGT